MWQNVKAHRAHRMKFVSEKTDTETRQLLKLPVDSREDNATVIQLVLKSLQRKAASQTTKAKVMAHQFQPDNLLLLIKPTTYPQHIMQK
jgi:hypothetical protein